MLEGRIEISDELAAEGFKRAMRRSALVQITSYYGNNLALIWVFVAIVDGIVGAPQLIFWHGLMMIAIGIAASAKKYFDWARDISNLKGWGFRAVLDEDGVTTFSDVSAEQRVNWSHYKNYVEYDSYLQIEDQTGNFSFLPKTPELIQLIEFTKRKIPEK